MKRLTLIALLVAFAVPAHAGAAVPCRNKIFNDWYADGKIASTYPRGCYASALSHIPPDARIYSSLADDIRAAMRASVRRQAGKSVPAQVGRGFTEASGKTVLGTSHTQVAPSTSKDGGAPAPQAAAPVSDTSSGSSIPLPILILGGLALLLAAAGAVGSGVKYARGRRR